MKPDEIQNILTEVIEQINQKISDEHLSDERIDEISKKLGKSIDPLSDKIAITIYKSLRRKMNPMLREHRRFLKDFEKRHYKLWKKGIDTLEAFLVLAFELGENFNTYYRNEAAQKQDYLFEALTNLHARAVLIGSEVLTLLNSGFSDGAHARWRTAHEISVVATFLSNCGNDVAKKYLEYNIIESYRAMDEYQRYAEALGQKKFSDDEFVKVKKSRDELLDKYGKDYGTQYGWAADALGNKKPNFSDIEKASGLDHLRPYYKMASYNVHANPKGIKFRLGLSDGANILLAGPSNYGLVDPAQGIAISILQITILLLNMKANIDSIVMGKILMKFVEDIKEAFMSIKIKMESYDASRKKS